MTTREQLFGSAVIVGVGIIVGWCKWRLWEYLRERE